MKQTLEYLGSFLVMVLILMGLTGFAYHLFGEGGWAESVTGGMWRFTTRSPLMALVVIACAIVLGVTWRHNRKVERQHGKAATVFFYVLVAAGVYFLGHLAIVGTF